MDVLFLDANILVSAAFRPQAPLRLVWSLSGVRLVTSAHAIEEARRNLPRSSQKAELDRLVGRVAVVPNMADARLLPPDVVLPEKDLPILLAAIDAGVTHLLTGDFRHFGPYYGRRIQGVLILPPGEYLRSRGEPA